jgi:hypothetical protein
VNNVIPKSRNCDRFHAYGLKNIRAKPKPALSYRNTDVHLLAGESTVKVKLQT